MTNETKFRPVTGLDEKIQKLKKNPGYVYFASDSGKIYFDTDNETRIVMGGSGAAIFYAEDNEVYDHGNDTYELKFENLERSDSFPKEGDIVINTDNCFYRVLSTDDETYTASKIAIAGTGGGTGTGGSGEAAGTASITVIGSNTIDTLFGESCIVEFEVEAKDSAGDNTTGGTVTWTLDRKTIASQHVSIGYNSFDVGPYLKNISGNQELKGTFSLDVGTESNAVRTKGWTITAIDVILNWNYNTAVVVNDNNLNLNWNVAGGASVSKTTHILIDGKNEITKEVVKVGEQSIAISRLENGLNHGKHQIDMWISYEVNGVTRLVPTISNEIIFADENNNMPIIALGNFKKNIKQYDTLMIPVYLYNSSLVYLYIDEELKETWEDIDNSAATAALRYWSYTSDISGTHKLKIVSGSVEVSIDITVESLNLTTVETSGYAFKLKASDFSSNNALKTWSCLSPEGDNVDITFSDNFDWINGGLQQELDEKGNLRQYICVKAGTQMTINYEPFKYPNKFGKDFKIVFKTINCGKYDAEIIKSYEPNYIEVHTEGEDGQDIVELKDTGIGFVMTAQDALFKSSVQSIKSQYCEDTYIEYEIDITPYAAEGSNSLQYITPWLAGVPAGITTFDIDSFQQALNKRSKIVIGSEYADVCLYLFKVYEKHLTNEEHLENFIMDSLNSQEMLDRYNRNDVLSDTGNGEIDWRKVVEKNPNCWVNLYKIPRMTKNKKDKIGEKYIQELNEGKESSLESAKYYALYKDGNSSIPVIEAGTDVGCPYIYNVQGTSSEKYVISAANLDTKFEKGLIDSNGNKIKKFALNDNVPAEKTFNTKVNVASCENANNALNAAWYNDHQPYLSAAKAKNPKKRDTMLFYPGLIFIQDENPNYELSDTAKDNLDLNIFKENNTYKASPFYKQYAICNFGNSKKDKATLHDVENPSEICIEVTDNQNIGQAMCQVTGRTTHIEKGQDGKDITVYDPFDITGQNLECERVLDLDSNGQVQLDEDGNEKTKLVGNDIFNAFYLSMSDQDYDVRYVNDDDGVANASPQQIKGFYDLINWFAQNDPSPYSATRHPYGYTERPFTERDAGAVKYDSKTIAEGITLYKDINCTEPILTADELMPDVEYYKIIKIVEDGVTKEQSAIAQSGVDYTATTGWGITFEPYTFKNQISFVTGDNRTHTYSPKLGGLRVSTYAKTYFTDSHEYRMAKLLSECEEHLIMDSIVYHYLFIERHLMVDNVAKNTFWTSEDKDNQYWSLIKDYDNDTADGIDNDGKLSFTYGIEPEDIQEDGQTHYYNAPDSVWFNFLHGLEPVRQHLYTVLNSNTAKNPWDTQKYLKTFEEWQNTIPERCWIEDCYRKYLRPYEVFNNNEYLAKFEGGQKKYQRRQFETYHGDYINSKYQINSGESIYIRANSNEPHSIELPFTMYSDCYIYQSWSQNTVKQRAKRGQVYNISVPKTISQLTDSTVYWYLPNTYSTIGNIGLLRPKNVSTNGTKKLQSLSIISPDSNRLVFDNQNALNIKSSVLLKELNLIGLESKTGSFSLNLSEFTLLEVFNGSNSLFSAIRFPIGAPLKNITMYGPTIISLRDLTKLESLTIESYDTITDVIIDNIDNNDNVNSLRDIILKTSNLMNYCLHNVKWKISDNSHINDTTYEIDFLETLYSKTPKDILDQNITSHAEALKGTLIITAEAYSGSHSLEIYEKYIEKFPNLELVFESPNCSLYSVEVLDGNGKAVWSRKFKESTTLTKEFFTTGGNDNLENLLLDIISSKSSTTYNTYTFDDAWECNGEKISLSIQKDQNDNYILSSLLPTSNKKYNENITLKPLFKEAVRTYQVKYYLDPTTPNDFYVFYPFAGTPVVSQDWVTDDSKFPMELVYPTRDCSDLGPTQAYRFIGWSFTENGEVFKGYDNLRIEANYTFYAQYEVVDFEENNGINRSKLALDKKYFNVVDNITFPMQQVNNYNINSKNLTDEPIKDSGVYISFKNYFNTPSIERGNVTKGKIFLPTEIDGKPVYGILNPDPQKRFVAPEVTHIYWGTKENEIYQIGGHAFSGWTNLSYIEIPKTLKVIDINAFTNCTKLIMPNITNGSLRYIGIGAFQSCLNLGETIIIPGTLATGKIVSLGQSAFSNCTNSTTVQFGTSENPINFNMENIGERVFAGDTIKNVNLYLGVTDITTETLSTEKSIFSRDVIPNITFTEL